MGFQHGDTTTASKAAIRSHWGDNVPNIHLVFDDQQKFPVTLHLECTQAVYDYLHDQDSGNEPADFLDELNKQVQRANKEYPSEERYPSQDREGLKTKWMDKLKTSLASEVIDRNKTDLTRRAEWTKREPEGTEEEWKEYNEEEGGSILPFLFGTSILNLQLGIESRPVASISEGLEAERTANRARVEEFLVANEPNASTTE